MIYLILESYYGRVVPVYCSRDETAALHAIADFARRTECIRSPLGEGVIESRDFNFTRVQSYSNSEAYRYDLLAVPCIGVP